MPLLESRASVILWYLFTHSLFMIADLQEQAMKHDQAFKSAHITNSECLE